MADVHAIIVRGKSWPAPYTGRVLRNDFVRRWHGDESGLRTELEQRREEFQAAVEARNYDIANVIVGASIAVTLSYAVIVFFLEPFYAAAGFTMYLSRRTELEAWDIEQELRHAFAR